MVLKNGLSWVDGALASISAVSAAILMDPTGAIGAVTTTLVQQSGALSSVAGIFGSQVAPNVPALQPHAGVIQGLAIVFGVVFALRQLDKVWDGLKDRLL